MNMLQNKRDIEKENSLFGLIQNIEYNYKLNELIIVSIMVIGKINQVQYNGCI